MPKHLILSAEMAGAVRSAMIAAEAAGGRIQIDFDSIDAYRDGDGWIVVREEPHGREEYKDLWQFELAYALDRPQHDLLTLAREMESLCETLLLDAIEAVDPMGVASWEARRDKCRSAIALSGLAAGILRPAT